jgi:hypothetical protein
LEFKQIAGSFVFRDGRISKVPSTEMEAVRSPLMGLFEKRRAKKFFEFLQGWKDEDPATHQGAPSTPFFPPPFLFLFTLLWYIHVTDRCAFSVAIARYFRY